MRVKPVDLKEEELVRYQKLSFEGRNECNRSSGEGPEIGMCDNCGCFIANCFTDKEKLLPESVVRSHIYGIAPWPQQELCISCNSDMEKEISNVREKYKQRRRDYVGILSQDVWKLK